MSLKVIGAGIGRTGTESLKTALEHLGFGKCYHMFELFRNPHHLPYWEELLEGRGAHPGGFFEGFQATVDFPGAIYYERFMEAYPDAKVVLTVRDTDRWHESASRTILRGVPGFALGVMKFAGMLFPHLKKSFACHLHAREIVHLRFFQGEMKDAEVCKRIYNEWNEQVRSSVPPDRLLVFDVKDGWGPLCEFLGVPEPEIPFPWTNTRDNFGKGLFKKQR